MADPGMGHNEPGIQNSIELEYGDEFATVDELVSRMVEVPDEIVDDTVEGELQDFMKQLTAHRKACEALRVSIKEPHLIAERAIDAMWKGKATGPLDKAIKAVRDRLTVYKQAKALAERRLREEAARRHAEEAAAARAKADEEAAAMKTTEDEAAAVVSHEASEQAHARAAQSRRAADAKPADMSRTRSDYGAVGSLRETWTGYVSDRDILDLEPLRQHIPKAALESAVKAFARVGGRELRGAKIYPEQKAVVR